MCVLQPCENPTGDGVWWRDDTQWCRYSAPLEALIKKGIQDKLKQIDLGKIMSTVHPKGARYVLDLKKMEQVAVSSGQKRPVLVVENPTLAPIQLQLPPPQQAISAVSSGSTKTLPLSLQYRDRSGNLQRYDSEIERELLRCMESDSQRFVLVPNGKGAYYFFDLGKMEQRLVSRVINGKPTFSSKAVVKVIAMVPGDGAMMASIAAKAEKNLRRKILVMVIERVRSDDNLDALLAERASPLKIVSKSILTYPAALYEKFVDSLEEVLQKFPKDIVEDIMSTAVNKEDGAGPVKIAFKPARHSPGTSLCISSDKAENSKAAFWISMAEPLVAATALLYQGWTLQLKILVYMVIVPAFASNKCAETVPGTCSSYVEVDRPEHGLPLAEVTVC